MQITPHFSFEELTNTSHTEYLEQNREYARKRQHALQELCGNLETVREKAGTPLIITSGVRCPELNKAVGGAENSQHVRCQAADIVPTKMSVPELFESIVLSDIIYDQLILEFSNGRNWVHISFSGSPRMESLIYDGKKYTKYKPNN